jgi:Histidine kinase
MTADQLIFSEKKKYRVTRHLVTWAAFCLFSFYIYIDINDMHDFQMSITYKIALVRIICYFPMYIFIVYIFAYVLIPQFILKKKYFYFALAAMATILFCFIVNLYPSKIFARFAYNIVSSKSLDMASFLLDWHTTVLSGIGVAFGASFIILAKGWYLRQAENTRLAKCEAENRTWLVKSRIQPEFMFQSLDSLHNKINSSSPEALKMILHLSDVFSYILYDCNEKYVLLCNELTAIQQLVTAETMSREGKPIITMDITGNCDNKYIIPLTLFSFLNDLADKKLDVDCIVIHIDIQDDIVFTTVRINSFSTMHNSEAAPRTIMEKLPGHLPANFFEYKTSGELQSGNLTLEGKVKLSNAGSGDT